MLAAAALVPDTVLLLPGVAGAASGAPALVALRSAAADAVVRAMTSADRVVVVAPVRAGGADRAVVGVLHLGAAAVGAPDHLLGARVPDVRLLPAPGAPAPVAGSPAAGGVVGVRLALDAGVPPDHLHLVEVGPGPVAALRAVGASTTAAGRTALVVVGSGSARHGAAAPQPPDDRAAAFDADLQAALATGGAAARDALAGLDPTLAAALAVTGWAPWQVLVGAVDAAGPREALGAPDVRHATVWHGAAHAVVEWWVAS
ncbi:hypothetical protein [Cellulomonas sp. S1-8]|uniref:hypothetical protein n=1 Tax=Cellulomonas sp. S1-8 TaxID=2904790 RepID=UPI002243663E|nr:hypothetical protein [Cellulomonas sp. S1-8]UZN04911.1 hypothetical protein OKX07_08410 [Cellulomonas sp. S1-8]